MASTLEIPSQGALPNGGWSDKDIDAIIDRMVHQESGGNPNAVGKKGEVGLVQIMPKTAAMYGVSPDMLRNPTINRYVARRYLTDMLKKYKGNMTMALEAYNAGPGRVDKGEIPRASQSYARQAMEGIGGAVSGLMGEGTANAEEPYTGPVVPLGSGKSPKGYTGPVIPLAPSATPTPKPEPFGAYAASWLPTIGQGVGDFVGAIGGAAVPGLGETGLPEYAGAVAGGAAGSALGAEGENAIRKHYGLSPVSVGQEAAKGGLASTVGGALPGILRLRKVFSIMKATGRGFAEAMEQVLRSDATLEGALGTGARKAEMLSQAPGTPVQRAYEATRGQELKDIGKGIEDVQRPFFSTRTPNNVRNVLAGAAGKRLELAGKPLRQALEDEINAEPMTVRREQVILSNLQALMRRMNPDQNPLALAAYRDIEKAMENDIDAVVGPANATRLKALKQMYARKRAEFPLSKVWRAMTEPQVADEILAGKANVDVIEQMAARGKLEPLRRATAIRIFKKMRDAGAHNPAEHLKALQKAVSSIEPEVFDALYGKGARADWLRTASDIAAKHAELLKSPNEAVAVQKAVKEFLASPGNLARAAKYLAGHRLVVEAAMLGTAYYGGVRGLAEVGAAAFALWSYESLGSPVARGLLRAASRTSNPEATARLLVAAISASMRAEAEHVFEPNRAVGGP